MKDTTIFIAMFTVFNIALYEPDSPLSKHIAAPPQERSWWPMDRKILYIC